MNLDDMKNHLRAQEAQIDQLLRLNLRHLAQVQINSARNHLSPMRRSLVVELVLSIIAVVWLGHFMTTHLGEAHLLIPAVLIDLTMIGVLGSSIWQLSILSRLQISGPVAEVQRELLHLRTFRIREIRWIFVLSLVLWLPIVIVLFEALLNADLWSIAMAAGDANVGAWIFANVAFGVVAGSLLLWASKRFGDRIEVPWIRNLRDELAGPSLARAIESLEAIERFRTED